MKSLKQGCAPHSVSRFPGLLGETGLTGAELAKRVDVHPNTVSQWKTGAVEPPGAVIAYLDLLAKVKALG